MAKKDSKTVNKSRKMSPLKWHICTEGKSEELYLRAYCKALGIEHLVDFNCPSKSESGCGRQHRSLIDQIQICIARPPHYIRTYVLHDLDETGNEKDIRSFDEATQIGKDANIEKVIYFIPCFEYWLLLHNNPLDANLSCHECCKRVKAYVYAKHKELGFIRPHNYTYKTDPALFSYFGGIAGSERATANAKRRWHGKGPPKRPSTVRPSTNIYLLLEELKIRAKELNRKV